MKSLREKVQEGMTEEECCDVLFSMVNWIEEEKSIGYCPEDILLDEDNRIQRKEADGLPNLVFCPPEMLADSPVRQGAEQQWFALGMFAYYMYCKADFYTRKKTGVLVPRGGCSQVIMPSDAAEIPFGEAVSLLTAVQPERRVEGLKGFLYYLKEKIPETAKIRYFFQDKLVGVQTKTLQGDIEDLWPNGRLKIGNVIYELMKRPLPIPYRPGKHQYDVQLTAPREARAQAKPSDGLYLFINETYCMEIDRKLHPVKIPKDLKCVLAMNGVDNENRLLFYVADSEFDLEVFRLKGVNEEPQRLEYITMVRPSNYMGKNYAVKLRYAAAQDSVEIQLTAPGGAPISPIRTVSLKKHR